MPAYVDAETGEAFIRMPRQVDQYPDADTSYGAPAPGPVSFLFGTIPFFALGPQIPPIIFGF